MRILIACQIHPRTIEGLRLTHEVHVEPYPAQKRLVELIRNVDVLVVRSGVSVGAAVLDAALRLGLVVRAGSGIDNVDQGILQERGISLERISGASARSVAELGFSLLLAMSRKLFQADRSVRDGSWERSRLVGWELEGKTLGVIGAGATGMCMCRLGVSFGMDVVACVKHSTPQRVAEAQQEGVRLVPLDEVILLSDMISVHVPLDESTRHMLDEAAFSRMKPGALLVDLSRGGVIDETALARALQTEGALGGAALDVHGREGAGVQSPFKEFDNVILTPHIGAQTENAHRRIGDRITEVIREFALRKDTEAANPAAG